MKRTKIQKRSGKSWAVLCVLCVSAAICCSGCATQAEREFVAADVRVVSLYLAKAQPAVEAYCDALDDAGQAPAALQLRIDTRVLAAEIAANAGVRIEKLRVENEMIAAARTALAIARSVLDSLAAATEVPHGATQPGNN